MAIIAPGFRPDVMDFVMVRFATVPFYSMRMGHIYISTWLDRRNIIWTNVGKKLYFQLPADLEPYTVISSELSEKLAPFAIEIKRRLAALQYSRAGKIHLPLTNEELELLAKHNIPIIL